MGDAARLPRITYAEYLALEEASETKHEWVDGEVLAMAGGTPRHARLAARVIAKLEGLLGPHGCQTFTSDLRVRIAATGRATYPDATLVCGPIARDTDDRQAIVNPTLVVEVLSASTEASDRGDKWRHYRRLSSLRTYVLIGTAEPRIEVYTRTGDAWRFSEAGPGERIRLGLHDATLEVDALYEGVPDDDEA